MPKFHVISGTVRVTILADDPHSAAVELLESRGGQVSPEEGDSLDHFVGEQILVKHSGERRPAERFITLHLLAHLNRQTSDAVWRKMLASFDPNRN